MKRKKRYFLLILVFILSLKSNISISQNLDTLLRNVTCLDVIKEYKNFWDQDTLGHNGFRLLVAEKYLKICNFYGIKWTDLLQVVGKPAHSFSLEDKTKIYHRIIIFKVEGWSSPGNVYLEFTVINNFVESFYLDYVDG